MVCLHDAMVDAVIAKALWTPLIAVVMPAVDLNPYNAAFAGLAVPLGVSEKYAWDAV